MNEEQHQGIAEIFARHICQHFVVYDLHTLPPSVLVVVYDRDLHSAMQAITEIQKTLPAYRASAEFIVETAPNHLSYRQLWVFADEARLNHETKKGR